MKSNLFNFFCYLGLWCQIQETIAKSNVVKILFSFESFIVLELTFRSLMHFELVQQAVTFKSASQFSLHDQVNQEDQRWIFSFLYLVDWRQLERSISLPPHGSLELLELSIFFHPVGYVLLRVALFKKNRMLWVYF